MISAVMPTYGRWDVAVERGEGPYLWATDGRKFLDFTSGIAVTGLGHCHPHLVGAILHQFENLALAVPALVDATLSVCVLLDEPRVDLVCAEHAARLLLDDI